MNQHRLEENTATKENLLLREREQNDATTKTQIESQERSEQLLKKFLDVDRKIDLLQDTIERYPKSRPATWWCSPTKHRNTLFLAIDYGVAVGSDTK